MLGENPKAPSAIEGHKIDPPRALVFVLQQSGDEIARENKKDVDSEAREPGRHT